MTKRDTVSKGHFMLGKKHLAEHNYNKGIVLNRGLSLLEVLVSSILLAVLLTGLGNIFVATKRLLLHARSRATAAEISQYYLTPLQMQITATNWGTTTVGGNCLRMFAGRDTTAWTDQSAAIVYTPDYDATIPPDGIIDIHDMELSAIPQTSIICRVSLKVGWVERSQ